MGLRPLAFRDCGFGSRRGHGCLSLVNIVCCQVELSASNRSLVRRSPTECGASECDHETSVRRPWPTRAVAHVKTLYICVYIYIYIHTHNSSGVT